MVNDPHGLPQGDAGVPEIEGAAVRDTAARRASLDDVFVMDASGRPHGVDHAPGDPALLAALASARAQLASDRALWNRIQDVSTQLLPGGDFRALMWQLLDVAVALTGSDGGCVCLAAPQGRGLDVAVEQGVGDSLSRAIEAFGPSGTGLLPLHSRVVVFDLQAPDAFQPDLLSNAIGSAGFRACQATPLVSRSGAFVGALMTFTRRPHAPNERDSRVLDLLARQAADFIDRCRADDAATRIRSNLAAIIDSVSDAIITLDPSGLVRTANRSVAQLFRLSPEDMVGHGIGGFCLPNDESDRITDVLAGMASGDDGLVRALECTMVRHDGEEFRAEVVFTELERGLLFTAVVRDVTQQRATEARSRQADRLAALGTLAAGLGHDMNNMLLPVRAHLNALCARTQRLGAADCAPHIVEIGQAVRYLQQLADGLHYLVTDAGHGDGGTEGARLLEWWTSTGALLRRALPPLTEVEVRIPEGLPAVRLSAHALTQAVLNLFVNSGEAIAARRDGRPGRVRVVAHVVPGGDAVELSIADNGIGMTESVRRRATDMFFTTKTRGMGTGLGLALVSRVAGEAGGSVAIESAEGEGTTIRMRLPFAVADDGQGDIDVALSIADGRAAEFMRAAMESRGFRSVSMEDPSRAAAWVVDPRVVTPGQADAWKGLGRGRVVVLWGEPARPQSSAWRGIASGTVPRATNFDALLVGVDQACSIIQGRIHP